jgi:CHASE3 domain sensor protein
VDPFSSGAKKKMSDDVVDIRKRIEEMRNEVSAAIISGREQNQATRALGELADIAISSNLDPADIKGWKKTKAPSDATANIHRSIDNALKMPAFTLNIRNQISNRLLLAVIGIQLLTNILLIMLVWMKIG